MLCVSFQLGPNRANILFVILQADRRQGTDGAVFKKAGNKQKEQKQASVLSQQSASVQQAHFLAAGYTLGVTDAEAVGLMMLPFEALVLVKLSMGHAQLCRPVSPVRLVRCVNAVHLFLPLYIFFTNLCMMPSMMGQKFDDVAVCGSCPNEIIDWPHTTLLSRQTCPLCERCSCLPPSLYVLYEPVMCMMPSMMGQHGWPLAEPTAAVKSRSRAP